MTKTISPETLRDTKQYLEWGLSEAEYQTITDDILGRLPNETELGLFAVMWSEHCSYKNSSKALRQFKTKGARGQVLRGPGEGAGIVDVGDGQAVVFKTESHNHPSAIEPYEGAATGVGGILRDIFSMGARPIANMNSIRVGELDTAWKKHLLTEIVHGISNYGNSMGIPTVGGETVFDASYDGNPLVNAFNLGLVKHEHMQVGQAHGAGNSIMYVGAKTGRDGIHGASFASKAFDSQAEEERSAVQVGDPFMEKLLMEACLDLIENHHDLLVGIQDMGAAGLVSSSSEMASKANMGVKLNLDLVPQREAEMTPYEMMLSESQERMLLCVEAGREQEVIDLFARYNLDAITIGEVIEEERYYLYHQGECVCDLPVEALTEGAPENTPEAKASKRFADFKKIGAVDLDVEDFDATLEAMVDRPNLASKKVVYNTYDSTVQTNTVAASDQLSDAAVVRIRPHHKGVAMSLDCPARLVYLDPERGGERAIVEGTSNIVASGASPLAITDCLNYGNPYKPEIYYDMWYSIKGLARACEVFDTPVVSGNVSLHNEADDGAVLPTPSIGTVGLIKNLDHHTGIAFQEAGDQLYLLGETAGDFSGSELQAYQTGRLEGTLPDLDLKAIKARQDQLLKAIEAGLVASAHDVSEGGLALNLLESSFVSGLGFKVQLAEKSAHYFSERPGRFVVSVHPDHVEAFEEACPEAQKLGEVKADATAHFAAKNLDTSAALAALKRRFEEAIPCRLTTRS